MSRTTPSAVQGVLVYNYDAKRSPDLTPFIDTASAMVDQVVTDAAARNLSLSTTQQELVERWLAAYCYTQMDVLFQSKSTQGASASFVTEAGLEGEGNRYKRMAIVLDTTGCLNALLNRKTARVTLLRVSGDPYGDDSYG